MTNTLQPTSEFIPAQPDDIWPADLPQADPLWEDPINTDDLLPTEAAPVEAPSAQAELTGLEALRWLYDQGAHFCRVAAWNEKGNSPGKRALGRGWQDTPLDYDAILPHVKRGGNVGMICGVHSHNLVLLDADENYQGFCDKFPELANGPAIVREGADKGKLLIRVDGELPPPKKFKHHITDQHPFFEYLSTGNQGVIPPSKHPAEGKPYRLVNYTQPIPTLTPGQLSEVCRMWAGSPLDLPGQALSQPATPQQADGNPKKAPSQEKGELLEAVLAYWTPLKVFEHFGYASDTEEESSGALRLKGHGGLLINKNRLTWALPSGGKGWGGGAFQAWRYCQTGGADCHVPKKEFFNVLQEMAEVAGIPVPQFSKNGRHKTTSIQPGGQPEGQPTTWPYTVQNNRLVYLSQAKTFDGESVTMESIICDFEASITQEAQGEFGDMRFTVTGKTASGRAFSLEIPAVDFSDERKLKAAIFQAAGAGAIVRAKMLSHLVPAIQTMSDPGALVTLRRYDRTGWAGGKFLIPGREPEGVVIDLPRKLPYELRNSSDLPGALATLDNLLQSMGPERTTIILSAILQAPLAELAGWRNERYGLFIVGRTGSLKTSTAQALMSVYGAGIMDDGKIIKWGEGATRNAIMALATRAHDMPLLIDNYKPSTGEGERGFTNLIHNILEGGEKDRLTRAAELRESKPVYCWPVVTGEDVPDKDPASLARMLIVKLAWHKGESNELLTLAQSNAHLLPAIGAAWLAWLESGQADSYIAIVKNEFIKLRGSWADWLRKKRADSVNILRLASSLSGNQLAFRLALYHPDIGPILAKYSMDHLKGIRDTALDMGNFTAQALEGRRFIDVLRQLVNSGRYILRPKDDPTPSNPLDADRLLGWQDEKGIYLQPDTTRKAVLSTLGPQALGSLSDRALHDQLNELGVIASKNKDGRWTRVIRIGSKTQRVLHLTTTALDEEEGPEDDPKP